MDKTYPQVGDKLYLRQFTGNDCVDSVKRPYTVIEVTNSKVVVQACEYIWPIYHCTGNPHMDRPDLEGQRVQFYDTIPEVILPDENGFTYELTWHSKRGRWGTKGRDEDYPRYAIFTKDYVYSPYLN